ncbi:MAG: MarR family transcriptional regulator [Pseudomonadales bacterium]|nr:MarR family transcriptional regulator [Pseudomonadales bacterium]MBO6564710.1 MarR family transcriptional regulator [Pseudomonadales bacterium]MBO6595511.1 MarR family transcriptional regulator [Pseudomonadales bacterium]MBO6657081.1 MarR family transcriptional regulator [Pseudomonadales bacterium]MBO6702011.1 MarR family transcriptional regulator [Pseudomonadales bacterium]
MRDYDDVLVSLRRITRAIDLQSKKLEKQTGLTTSQLLVMDAIHKLGNPSPSAIAREVVLSQATVTSLLDRLVKRELVERHKNLQDKRQVSITLTDKGNARLEDAPELLQAGFLREFRKLPDWQRSSLIAGLQHIAYMMDAEELDASPVLDVGDLHSHAAVEPGSTEKGQ